MKREKTPGKNYTPPPAPVSPPPPAPAASNGNDGAGCSECDEELPS